MKRMISSSATRIRDHGTSGRRTQSAVRSSAPAPAPATASEVGCGLARTASASRPKAAATSRLEMPASRRGWTTALPMALGGAAGGDRLALRRPELLQVGELVLDRALGPRPGPQVLEPE